MFQDVPGVFRVCSVMFGDFPGCSAGFLRCSGSILPGFTDNPLKMRSATFKRSLDRKLGF